MSRQVVSRNDIGLYVVFSSLVTLLTWGDWFDADATVFVLSGLLVLYNGFEALWLFFNHRKWFIINPIILALAANFFMYQGGV